MGIFNDAVLAIQFLPNPYPLARVIARIASSAVTSVTGVAPVTSTGGSAPQIGITPATPSTPGSMSAADKTKLDALPASPVSSVTGVAPVTSTGGSAPQIGITPATPSAAGSMSAADKQVLDVLSVLDQELLLRPPAGGNAVTTFAPLTTMNGFVALVPRFVRGTVLRGRLTAATTVGAVLTVALYQCPGGVARGTASLVAQGTFTVGVVGAQDWNIVIPTSDLVPGVVYVLFGRNAVAGMTCRAWTIGSIERVTANVAAQDVPETFSTAFSPAAPPASFSTPSSLTAVAASPALVAKFDLT